jgi:hypothetical protein
LPFDGHFYLFSLEAEPQGMAENGFLPGIRGWGLKAGALWKV